MLQLEKSQKNYLIGECVSLVILTIAIIISCCHALQTLYPSIAISSEIYYVIMLILGCVILCALQSKIGFRIYILLLLSFFVWLSFADIGYDPIDEAQHFEYINHIVEFHKLPIWGDPVNSQYLNAADNSFVEISKNMVNYEVVQSPLYYILMAVISAKISNAYIRFHVCRLVSLCSVLIVFFLVNKTIYYMKDHGILKINNVIYRMALALTIFNPGYLYRMSRLNNESLVCVLMATLLHFSVKCITEGYTKRLYWILSIICVALFLTKTTSIYAYAAYGIIILSQKKIKEAIMPVIVGAACAVPWFAFNYISYGRFTAMKQHIEYILPIVNPNNEKINLFEACFDILPFSFFSAQEVNYSLGELFWLAFFWIVVVFLIIDAIFTYAIRKKSVLTSSESMPKVEVINFWCAILLILAIVCLAAGTIFTRINAIIGRYFYPVCIVIIILLLTSNVNSKKIKLYTVYTFVLILTIITTKAFVTFTDRIFTNENLYGSHVTNIVMSDITDDNWNHGVSWDGQKLLINNNGANYSILSGRAISLGDQKSIIIRPEENGEYVYLHLTNAIDAKRVDTNIVKLGSTIQNIPYNTDADILLEGIEDKPICQEITIKENVTLTGFQVQLATYWDTNYDAFINYKLSDSHGNVILEGDSYIENIADNAYTTISLTEPIQVQENEILRWTFTIDNSENKPIAVYVTQNDMYSDGTLYFNNEEKSELDICFKLCVN